MRTTAGQLLINAALPAEYRDYTRRIDKKSVKDLLRRIAVERPELYRDTVHNLMNVGREVVFAYGASFSLKDLLPPKGRKAILDSAAKRVTAAVAAGEDRDDATIRAYSEVLPKLVDSGLSEARAEGNPFAVQVDSGARGNAGQLNTLRGASTLVTDHRNRTIPVPIVHSYAEGLTPAEYAASLYGARRGLIATKFATQQAGAFGKQLGMAVHRLVVSEDDCGTSTGLPVSAEDMQSVGALLAADAGRFMAGTVLTPDILKSLGSRRILVRSPITCKSEHGICAKCAGVREGGDLPDIGENVGLPASQAISERLSQGQLNVRHTGGVAGGVRVASGFDYINQCFQVPKAFKGGAPVAELDGKISAIDDAPQGGKYVTVAGEQHWVPADQTPIVELGDVVEAGDVLADGVPNPADVVRLKGIGEGRRYFVQQLQEALDNSGVAAHRRNLELIARGVINHVRVTDLDGPAGTLPDDVIPYSMAERTYAPRVDASVMRPKRAVGSYLEQPALHFSVGTRVTPTVAKMLDKFGVEEVLTHAAPPPFAPEMRRLMDNLSSDPDWFTRMAGWNLRKNLLQATHRGMSTTPKSTSYVHSLALGGRPLSEVQQLQD